MVGETVDSMDRESLIQLQLERLQMTLNRAYLNVDFYRSRMDSLGIAPEDVETLEDFRRLPLTTSEDLADHYPYGLFAVPLKSVVRLKITASRDGRPIVVGFTRRDVALWQSLVARLFRRLGICEKDIVQIAFNYSLFPGAFTFNYATEQIGATVAPSATVSARIQLQIMRDFRSTVMATTPSFAMHLLDTLEGTSTDSPSSLMPRLRMLILGPDPVPPPLQSRLEQRFGVPVYRLYGVTEMVEPGLAAECSHGGGLHVSEDHFLVEVIRPSTGDPVPVGEEGELVISTLSAEAYPFIRYRTGDIVRLDPSPCPCGLKMVRMSPVIRRSDNRISVRGIPIHPERVEKILREMDPHVADYRLVVNTRYSLGETLEVWIVRENDKTSDEAKGNRLEKIRSRLRRELGLGVRVLEVPEDRLPQEGLTYKTTFRGKTEY